MIRPTPWWELRTTQPADEEPLMRWTQPGVFDRPAPAALTVLALITIGYSAGLAVTATIIMAVTQ